MRIVMVAAERAPAGSARGLAASGLLELGVRTGEAGELEGGQVADPEAP